jgi:hypothetical protein
MSLFTAAIKRTSLPSLTRPFSKVKANGLLLKSKYELTPSSQYLRYLHAPCVSNQFLCV